MENINVLDEKTLVNPLNLVHKLRQKTVLESVKNTDWERGSDAPLVVELDPTTACNLACPDCISRDLLNQGFFSRERLIEMAEELVQAKVKAVILIGGGAPLAHPAIGDVIDYLGENDVQIGITTNGLLIDRYLDPIAKYATWVRVSMDAGTSDTFNLIRPSFSGKSEFDRAMQNIKTLSKVMNGKFGYSFMIYSDGKFDPSTTPVTRKGKGGKKADEVAAATKMAMDLLKAETGNTEFSNVGEIYQAAKLAKESGCDYFEVKPMYDIEHFGISQKEQLRSLTIDQLDKCQSLVSDTFQVLEATKLRHVLNGEAMEEPKNYNRCAVSELRTLITPSGVYVCPYFRGRGDKRLGDLRKMSLQELRHGEKRQKVMEKLNPEKDCRMHCIRHNTNMILEDMIKSGTSEEPIPDFDLFI